MTPSYSATGQAITLAVFADESFKRKMSTWRAAARRSRMCFTDTALCRIGSERHRGGLTK
jgi:hypothetical protein